MWVDVVVVGHQPVFVITYDQVSVLHAKEAADDPFPRPRSVADGSQQLPLTVLFREDVFMGPGLVASHCLPPRSEVNQFGQRRHIRAPVSVLAELL